VRARSVASIVLPSLALAGVATQFVAFASPWQQMGLFYLTCAVIGLDAWVVGVRAVRGEGPSIRNLSPGGWAVFVAMVSIVALPAYLFARRRGRRGYSGPTDPVGPGTWVALGALTLAGLTLLRVG
jgi:hypothetical protein